MKAAQVQRLAYTFVILYTKLAWYEKHSPCVNERITDRTWSWLGETI